MALLSITMYIWFLIILPQFNRDKITFYESSKYTHTGENILRFSYIEFSELLLDIIFVLPYETSYQIIMMVITLIIFIVFVGLATIGLIPKIFPGTFFSTQLRNWYVEELRSIPNNTPNLEDY